MDALLTWTGDCFQYRCLHQRAGNIHQVMGTCLSLFIELLLFTH